MRSLARILATAAFAVSSSAAFADSCPSSGNIPSGPPNSGGGATTLILYNNVNAPAAIYRSDGGGNLRVERDVTPNEIGDVSTSRGQVFVIETSLDGVPMCAGTVVFIGNGDCHVSLDQDADNFYLSPEGACEIQ